MSWLHLLKLATPETASTQVARTPPKLIAAFMKDAFKKAGHPEYFDPSIDYDGIFRGTAAKVFKKSPINLDEADKDDAIMDALMQVVTPQTIKAADPSKDLVKYFAGMFSMRMITIIKTHVERKLKEDKPRGDDDRTDDEFLDSRVDDHGPSTEHQMEYKQLILQLHQFLGKKPEGRYYVELLDKLGAGYSNSELAEYLGVSPAIITRYLQRMKEAIIEFAKKTNNALLAELMTEYLNKRKHAIGDDTDFLVDLLKDYKKQTGSVDEPSVYDPVGEVIGIKPTAVNDPFDEAFTVAFMQDPHTSAAQLNDHREAFTALEGDFSELMETGAPGKLVGLQLIEQPSVS